MFDYSVRRCASGVQFARKTAAMLCANVRLVRQNFSLCAAMMASAMATSASFAWRHVSIDGRYAFCTKDCAVSTENRFYTRAHVLCVPANPLVAFLKLGTHLHALLTISDFKYSIYVKGDFNSNKKYACKK